MSEPAADFGSLIRLIFTLLGLPPLNQFDAAASLPLDFFTGSLDVTPYTVQPPDTRLFNPDAAFKPFDRRFNWQQLAGSVRIDDPDDMQRAFRDPDDALAAVVMGGRRGAVRPRTGGR